MLVIRLYMQISSKELIFLITLTTGIFLLAPAFLIVYISVYNKKKARHQEEKENLKKAFELELLKSQVEVQENLLQSVAADLHDNIGQLLSLTSITLSAVRTGHADQEKITSARELTLRTIHELRQLSKKMNGQELIRQHLPHAISYELDWLKRSGSCEVIFTTSMQHFKPEHAGRELILFRLFQELLSNVLRHAEATAITVALEQPDGKVSLKVTDNGRGFDQEKLNSHSGLGLYHLQQRTALIGGEFSLQSTPGAGTEICIIMPYQ